MSTRAVYTFKDKHQSFHVYKHHDGYPSGAVQWIENGYKKFNENENYIPNQFEACELATRFICGNKERYGDVYLSNGYDKHGDLDYRYEIISNSERSLIKAYRVRDSSGKNDSLIFSGTFQEFKEKINSGELL